MVSRAAGGRLLVLVMVVAPVQVTRRARAEPQAAMAGSASVRTPARLKRSSRECAGPTLRGEGTYYHAAGIGNCSVELGRGHQLVAAVSTKDYRGSSLCGACVAVTGPRGSVVVRVADRCPGCRSGDLDLSRPAFARIAPLRRGRVPVTWRIVPCAVRGPVRYKFKEGSNRWWTAIQVRNHRHPIVRVEGMRRGRWVTLRRRLYNYFVASPGLGVGPYTVRITDIHGHQLVDSGLAFAPGAIVSGAAQLPACR